ncbi:MAG: hypothetical protein WC599_13630, partial [Bacteroidales bacterium]
EYKIQDNYRNYVGTIYSRDHLLLLYSTSNQHIQEYKHTCISLDKDINIIAGFDTFLKYGTALPDK